MFFAGLLLAPFAVATFISQQPDAIECEASRADKIRGKYENKIRFFASPEKVFEIFASKKDDETGEVSMSYGDFLHALTPYNNGELLDGGVIEKYTEENEIPMLKFADADNSGTINFSEFLFFLAVF